MSTPSSAPNAGPTGAHVPEVERYVREVARLERLLEGVAVERRRLKWYPVLGLVVAPLGLFYAPWLAAAASALIASHAASRAAG